MKSFIEILEAVKLKIKKDTDRDFIVDFKSGGNNIRFKAMFSWVEEEWIVEFGVFKNGIIDPEAVQGNIKSALATFSGIKEALRLLFKKHDVKQLSFGPASDKLQRIYKLMAKKHGFVYSYDGTEAILKRKTKEIE